MSFIVYHLPRESQMQCQHVTMWLHVFGYFLLLIFQLPGLSCSISCHKDLKLNWTVTIDDSPIVSPPLLLRSNNYVPSQLIVLTHDGTVSVVNTASGSEDAQWPIHLPEKSFFAGPLMYDIDHDGSMDILLTASDGEILFLSLNGTLMPAHNILLPCLMVKRNWNIQSVGDIEGRTGKSHWTSPDTDTQFILLPKESEHYSNNLAKTYVLVDTHILSTPVIADFDGDNINSELIIAVNFYFENDIKKDHQRLKSLGLEASEVDFYLANGIIVVDLKTQEIIANVTLELTLKSSTFPAYLLSSPTVVDFDGELADPEVIIGSLTGRIHVFNKNGKYPHSFELSDSIHGEIAVGDVNSDGKLEIIVVDRSANVICYDNEKIMWEVSVSGTMTAGAQIQDINQDGVSDVVIATNDGYIWVLEGPTGKVLLNWPLKLGNEIHSKVLFNKHLDWSVDMVVISDGTLNVINGTSHCLEVIPTEEMSYAPVIYDGNHMAFIISTNDGVLMSFQMQHQNRTIVHDKLVGVTFLAGNKDLDVVNSAYFDLEFEIYDYQDEKHKWKSYTVIVSFSTERGIIHQVGQYNRPGIYSLSLRAPQAPRKACISVELCNEFKICTQDTMFILFHPDCKNNLILYVILPFLIMVCLLLALHGYPEGNLLPMWETSKRH